MLRKFFKYLKQWEKYEPSNFWFCTIGLSSIVYFSFGALSPASEVPCQSQAVVVQLRSGCQQQHEVTNSVDNLAKKEYFRKMLVKHFPDFESRASLEERQAIIYQKAVKKITEYRKISPLLKNYQKWLTAEEKSSIDYYHGTGIYAKFQDPKTSPNIHDTRKTFLKKMENQEMREKFLETYNQLNSSLIDTF
jgi:hypothetical protein